MSSVRRIVGARRKVGATIAALALGVGVAVMAAPLTASAHSATPDVTAVCSTDGATRTVTYTGTTSNVPAGVTGTLSVTAVTPTSAASTIKIIKGQVVDKDTYSFTEAVSGTEKSASATAHLVWSDGATPVDAVKSITFPADCTVPTPPTENCVAVLWQIPGGVSGGGHEFDQPQKYVTTVAAQDCKTLPPVTPPTTCESAYQYDLYLDDDTTKALIAGGHLDHPGVPAESWPSTGSIYKYFQYDDKCVPPTQALAKAAISTTPPTCTTDGTIDFTSGLVHATWADNSDVTDGTRIAVADAGYTFADSHATDNGTKLAVNYTLPGTKLTGAQCFPKDALASASIAAQATCTSPATIDWTTGLVNATWADTDNSDVTDGTRIAVATAGHLFADSRATDGGTKLPVSYTIPAQLTNCDATAGFSTTPATCAAPGTVGFTITNATWDDAADITDGSRTATAASGHTFADGSTTATVTYTIPSQLTNCAVIPPVTPPTVTPPTVTPPVVSPPTVTPPTTATTTVTKVDTPTVTPEKTTTTTKTVSPTVLASTGINDSTPIAGTIALFALLFGVTIVFITTRHRRKTSGE